MRSKVPLVENLEPLDLGIAQLQALGVSEADSADQLGISEAKLKARKRRPAYRHAIAQLRNQMAARTMDRLNFSMGAATDYLTKVVMDESEDTGVRVRSARAILQTVAQFASKGISGTTGAAAGAEEAAETIQQAFNEHPEALEHALAAEEILERQNTQAQSE